MKPQEALNVLFQVTGLVQLNREDHNKVTEAFKVLQEVVNPPKKKVEKK